MPRTLIRIAAGNREAGLRELLEARRAVEMEIARLAARRAPEEDFKRMQESIDRFASYVSGPSGRDDPVQRLYLDYLFHYAMGYAARATSSRTISTRFSSSSSTLSTTTS